MRHLFLISGGGFHLLEAAEVCMGGLLAWGGVGKDLVCSTDF